MKKYLLLSLIMFVFSKNNAMNWTRLPKKGVPLEDALEQASNFMEKAADKQTDNPALNAQITWMFTQVADCFKESEDHFKGMEKNTYLYVLKLLRTIGEKKEMDISELKQIKFQIFYQGELVKRKFDIGKNAFKQSKEYQKAIATTTQQTTAAQPPELMDSVSGVSGRTDDGDDSDIGEAAAAATTQPSPSAMAGTATTSSGGGAAAAVTIQNDDDSDDGAATTPPPLPPTPTGSEDGFQTCIADPRGGDSDDDGVVMQPVSVSAAPQPAVQELADTAAAATTTHAAPAQPEQPVAPAPEPVAPLDAPAVANQPEQPAQQPDAATNSQQPAQSDPVPVLDQPLAHNQEPTQPQSDPDEPLPAPEPAPAQAAPIQEPVQPLQQDPPSFIEQVQQSNIARISGAAAICWLAWRIHQNYEKLEREKEKRHAKKVSVKKTQELKKGVIPWIKNKSRSLLPS